MKPSAFMRLRRPECYSDSSGRVGYELDCPTLSHHLETLTARNQTHDFEIFCRKLCERTICPNLRPATGPEGGGDGKVDTDTIPIAAEIRTLTFVGDANGGTERWAFAFSAKKDWAKKARSDVDGIVSTAREYTKIYFVTSRFARAKDRARIEDDLSKKYGVQVIILDRSWIIEAVIEGDRKDIALNYLQVGREVVTARQGPADFSRSQQLENIEKELTNPEAYPGLEIQRATEALVAARLSRSLERPRTETEGRFLRAIRLASAGGTHRQQLLAKYEWIWTAVWWFDDVELLNSAYDEFDVLLGQTDFSKNIELQCNLLQALLGVVNLGHLSSETARLSERTQLVCDKLLAISKKQERPNNATQAHASFLVIQASQAAIKKDTAALSALWPQFSTLLRQAKGLGEFQAEQLIEMIEFFGSMAASDKGYARLVDEVAAFVAERTSEGEGALILLKRAERLDFDENLEMIRLLGKAAYQLSKKEYAESFVRATQLLALAYRSAGLLWAARATCLTAIGTIVAESGDRDELPVSIVPTLVLLGWISIELRHLPDFFETMRLLRGCTVGLPLDEKSKARALAHLEEFDLALGSIILNLPQNEREQLGRLPDVLARLDFFQSRAALLYALAGR